MIDLAAFDAFRLSDDETAALSLSLQTAALAVLVSTPPAIATGVALARGRFAGREILNALVHLPLVLPPVVVGYLLLVLLGRNGPIGALLEATFGVRLAFSTEAVVIACAVVSFPLYVRAVRQAAEAADRRLEAAARTLGASELRVFCSVTLPAIAPGVLTGMTLAFARGLGEFGATITFAANIPGETQTLPLALFTVTQSPGGDAAAAKLCLLSVGLAFLAIGLSEWMTRTARMEAAR